MLFWDCMNGLFKMVQVVFGFDYEEGVGYLVNIYFVFRYVMMVEVEFDNVLSYFQSQFQVMMVGVCGVVVYLGKFKMLQVWVEIEFCFKLQVQCFLYQLLVIIGFGFMDLVWKKVVVVVDKCVCIDEFEYGFDCYIVNENLILFVCLGYEVLFECLCCQLVVGVIKLNYLFVFLCKLYFFIGLYKVCVIFDDKNYCWLFLNFLGVCYMSLVLQCVYELKRQFLWICFDLCDLCILFLFCDNGEEFGVIIVMGQWGCF